jgi:hypothetical protein
VTRSHREAERQRGRVNRETDRGTERHRQRDREIETLTVSFLSVAFLPIATHYALSVPGHGHSGGYERHIVQMQDRNLPHLSPSPFKKQTTE